MCVRETISPLQGLPRGRSSGGARRRGRRGRALLAAAPAAAAAAGVPRAGAGAAVRAATAAAGARAAARARVQQLVGRVGVVGHLPERVAAAGAGRAGAGPALRARAHAVRLPGRERRRAVVRAQPDHHQRDAVAGARLAARHAERAHGPRARELRGAAALARPP